MAIFSWDKISCQDRLGPDGELYPKEEGQDNVSVAEKDAERILTSSTFRRMQGKTQVYPLPLTDFVRNRLTHTLEVAQIGRSIARIILNNVTDCPDELKFVVPQLVYNGCLLHDIGNPPYGHSGESSIREFFETNQSEISIIGWALSADSQRRDLISFDGNAQGFRIATKLAGWKYRGGMRLCAGTLTTMTKYAFSSSASLAEKNHKFGFMSTESEHAKELFKKCGLVDDDGTVYRNPLSLIVEAADDIAYLTSDVQDAHRYKDLQYSTVAALLKSLSSPEDRPSEKKVALNNKDEDSKDNEISYLRAAAVSRMTRAAAAILRSTVFGTKTQIPAEEKFEIWSNPNTPQIYQDIGVNEREIRKECASLIYRGPKKVSTQVAGGRIIKFILRTQLEALDEVYTKAHKFLTENPGGNDSAKRELATGTDFNDLVQWTVFNINKFVSHDSAQVFWSMPGLCRDIVKELLIRACRPGHDETLQVNNPQIAYELVQISVDFVSGTTDRYLSDYSKSLGGPHIT